jgi:hypothetical protein
MMNFIVGFVTILIFKKYMDLEKANERRFNALTEIIEELKAKLNIVIEKTSKFELTISGLADDISMYEQRIKTMEKKLGYVGKFP